MKITLEAKDINNACREWLERHHNLSCLKNPMSFTNDGQLTIVYDLDPDAPEQQPYR